MRHSRTNDTESRTRQAWIERFWVSDNERDFYLIGQIIDNLLQSPPPTDPLQPCSLDVAEILRHLDVDQTTLMAALLCDSRFQKNLSLDEVEKEYGQAVRRLCEDMRNLQRFRDCVENTDPSSSRQEQGEQLRRMLMAMIKDIRTVLIKLAWSLQHLRLLSREELSDLHRCVARMSMDLYAPMANRLGISQVKWELEDLSFRFLHPDIYKGIAKSLADKRIEREQYIADFIHILKELLVKNDIQAEVYGRPKHLYSIWKKISRKQIGIDELYDLRAVRVMVADTGTCYRTLDAVHNTWRHIPEEYDDYISNSKPNGYESIHTVVVGPESKFVEVQIRTHEMHRFAELGMAAHWYYKEGGRQDQAMSDAINSMRRLLDSNDSDSDLMEDFRTEVFSDRVFVITPKGRIIDMPKGSTSVDFAYHVHTSVGHRCRGAKVNGNIVPLNYALRNGDQVEILTSKNEHPRQDWMKPELGFVKSGSTRQKVRQWFSQQNHEQNAKDGERILDKERHLLNLGKLDYAELARQFSRPSERDFLIAVGRNEVSPAQIRRFLLSTHEAEFKLRKTRSLDTVSSDIEVRGVSKLYTQLATCCHPVNGDPIAGYLSQGRGVIVHRTDCPDFANLRKEREERIIEVDWGSHTAAYAADITVSTYNKSGVLGDIASLLAKEKVNIHSLHTRDTHDPCLAVMDFTLEIRDVQQLGEVLEKLLQLPSVIDAQRKG
ncbi:RelA/SpoT family protein [Thiothrix subterranea]|uniref:GTP pyrophosphokinase n=1 Tax=Thiothrix subterranea TaxID=2735563 RepID=A0AA51MPD7_9GAMM|nr:bifunctional (p)ppGpp synthetase/guanosine-3',5'-bis(diphosphate) 3'-pyrophosphohydrolase [Thiothrix subterranea]MDQ5768331.1 bifunctional (p)ppGpp synthetase/guanosine-3',5'-bis(diphosphate) 3'-pyrophosphohydrolase [Thiothrix subterranea]WML87858.1 bifunctional (p)ppGpp synthetase/guanosine-3',5'-bis(diphosphate) 3'-pyrophosphohydrolase [Thiothrix subterranea]